MSTNRLFNWALAGIIAAITSTSCLLDGPTDTEAAQAASSSLQDAQQAARADQHLAKARKAAGVDL